MEPTLLDSLNVIRKLIEKLHEGKTPADLHIMSPGIITHVKHCDNIQSQATDMANTIQGLEKEITKLKDKYEKTGGAVISS